MIKSHRPDEDSILLTVHAARVDAAVAMAFKEEARRIIAEETGRVILDLQEVEFLDSSGLGALVAVMKMLDGGRRLELANCGDVVRKVLALTRMDSVFVLHDRTPQPATDASHRIAGQDAA